MSRPNLSVTVACAVPNSVFVKYIPQMQPILERPLAIRDGDAYPPDAPGHGSPQTWMNEHVPAMALLVAGGGALAWATRGRPRL